MTLLKKARIKVEFMPMYRMREEGHWITVTGESHTCMQEEITTKGRDDSNTVSLFPYTNLKNPPAREHAVNVQREEVNPNGHTL